eukprot:SAG11_NODE_18315_length_494_cov_1.949367_1_plen_73_part_00
MLHDHRSYDPTWKGAYEWNPHIDEYIEALTLELEIKEKELRLHELRSSESSRSATLLIMIYAPAADIGLQVA